MDLDQIMLRMGFLVTDRGPYVTELRALVARQMSEGMVNRSSGTWADECYERDGDGFIVGYKISAEDRAKSFLEVEWALSHGHSHEVECLDSFPINRYFNMRDMRWHYEFKPSRILPWLRDQWRVLWFYVRIGRDKLLMRQNPYGK